jgi:hypothetical protein
VQPLTSKGQGVQKRDQGKPVGMSVRELGAIARFVLEVPVTAELRAFGLVRLLAERGETDAVIQALE